MTATSATADAPSRRRGRYVATVVANVPLCREHNRLTFRMEGFPASAPGQFVQVRCRDVDNAPLGGHEELERDWPGEDTAMRLLSESEQPDLFRPTPILRRPFSIAARRSTPAGEEIDLINRDIGPGTHWLFNLKAGDLVDLIGPLGNTFTFPGPGGLALLVGGGVGIPPMIYIAQALAELNTDARQPAARRAVAFCGALSKDLMPLEIEDDDPELSARPGEPRANVVEFARFGFPAVLSTDDGSYGYHGRVTGALVEYLYRLGESDPAPILYTCGPEPMMKAVATIARERGLECQVAVERAMACGMGTCQSCVIRETFANERGWRYRLACTDGPVFEASTLLW